MALLWIEGCEGFGTTTGIAPFPAGIVGKKYALINNESAMTIEAGRVGDYSLRFFNQFEYIRTPALTTNATMCVGLALKISALPTAYEEFLAFYDGAFHGMNVAVNSDGTLVVVRDTTVLAISSQQLSLDTWYFIEFKVLCNNTTGTYELKVNETTWLSASSVDTQVSTNAYHTAFELGGITSITNVRVYVDDIYCLDGSGTVNNDFLSNVKVVALHPDAAGDNTDWTPNAGTNYAAVDEEELDSDTTYVETSTTLDKDLYNFGSVTAESIKGLQVVTEVRVTDAQSYDLNALVKSGVTEDGGSAETITSTSYVTHVRMVETNPDTSSLWTVSEVNAAQFGIKAT